MKILCVDMLVTRLDVLYAEVSFRKQVQSHRFWSLRHPPHESLKALAEFLMTEKLEADKLAMTIPGHLCSYHLFHVPFTKKKEILLNVPFEVEERGPFTPEEILHSFQVLNKTKHQSEIMAAIIPKNLYNEFIENIRTFNLEPEIITPGPIALAYSLLPFSKNSQGPMMCIDVRDTYTYIVVTHQQSVLACRTYPLGLNHFVVPEATIRGISYDEAYQDLMQSGPHIPPGEISDELRDIIKPFFVEIKKTILNVRSGGHPYISAILPSGYAQEWQSFEELLLHNSKFRSIGTCSGSSTELIRIRRHLSQMACSSISPRETRRTLLTSA
jgi:Tfp pilus assembly PilM family ATPase